MLGVGMDGHQVVGYSEQFVYRSGRRETNADPFNLEIRVMQGRVREERAGCEGPDELRPVEGDLLQVEAVTIFQSRHVALVRPAGDVALVVEGEGVEAARADYHLDPRVEQRREDRVVAAQGVPDGADAPGVDLIETLQDV